MKKGLVLFSLLLVLVILAIVPYMRCTKKKRIVNYLNTYHPELMYEIESFERDTFYYRGSIELSDYNTQLKLLSEGVDEDDLLELYIDKVDGFIKQTDSVYIRPYYVYMITGDASKMDVGANLTYGYTVKLKSPVGYYYVGIFEDSKTKYLFYDTRSYLHKVRDIITEYEIFNNRLKRLYDNIPEYPHRFKNDTIN